MGNTSTSDEEYERITLLESLSQRETLEEWPHTVAKIFCSAADSDRKMLLKALDDKVEFTWFGRTIFGSRNVVKFLNLIAPYSNHKLLSALELPLDNDSEESMKIESEENKMEIEVTNVDSEPPAPQNDRKRSASSPTSFDKLRDERNDQKNKENLENTSTMRDERTDQSNNENLENTSEMHDERTDQSNNENLENTSEMQDERNEQSNNENLENTSEMHDERTDQSNNENLENTSEMQDERNDQKNEEYLENASKMQDERTDQKNEEYLENASKMQYERNNQKDEENTTKITPESNDNNNNFPSFVDLMQIVSPDPVCHKETVDVEAILEKLPKKSPEKKTKKVRVIKMRAKLHLGILPKPGQKRRIWARKLNAIFIQFDEKIKHIEYVGNCCARNLLRDFDKLEEEDE